MPPKDNTVLMEGVTITKRNFSGREDQYNAAGSRTFLVLLPEDVAQVMLDDGWNVKKFKDREEDGEVLLGVPFLNVALRYEPITPRVVLITSRGRSNLDESEVEMLDWADITNVDLIIRPSYYTVNGKSGIKAYVKSIYVTIDEDPLELKYGELGHS